MNAASEPLRTCYATSAETRDRGLQDLAAPLLATSNLAIYFEEHGKRLDVVHGLDYEVFSGTTLAIIGASGSGKSLGCRALLGLLPRGAKATGSIRYRGSELLNSTESELRRQRGGAIGMVFQEAERALNPTMQVGYQISEAIRAHEPLSKRAARRRVLDLLQLLKLPAPENHFNAYPHELSGGMRQRIMIAIAISARPALLIADEPTSALDAFTGAQIMELLMDLQRQLDMALILVSHDMRLVQNYADSVLVMRAGRCVEYAKTSQLLASPQAEYTKAMLDAIPRFGTRPTFNAPAGLHVREVEEAGIARDREGGVCGTAVHGADRAPHEPLLEVRNVVHEFCTRRIRWSNRGVVRALCDISFNLMPGEALGIVGETGAGKSTLVRMILQKPRPTSGAVLFRGQDLAELRGRRLREQWRAIQMVFQDPFASVNPTWRVVEIVEEPLVGHRYGNREERRRRVEQVLNLVGLPCSTYGDRRPSQLSGGECQRVAIARALALQPKLIICDEPLSSLDALIQKQIVTLFRRLRAEIGTAFLFISHDLARVRELSDRVVVMHLGQICEIGPVRAVCQEPFHPYMAALVASVKSRYPSERLKGDPPSLVAPPSGCRFHTRCDRARERCKLEEPRLRKIAEGHSVACHFPIHTSVGWTQVKV